MSTTTQILFNSPALHSLKRDQLVKLCKIHSLKASGKNVELIARLKQHAQALPPDNPLNLAVRSEKASGTGSDGDDLDGGSTARPSEQWEVVMDSIQEVDEENTLKSRRGGTNTQAGEFGTGVTKLSGVSSSIKTLANSLGLKRNASNNAPTEVPPVLSTTSAAIDEQADNTASSSLLLSNPNKDTAINDPIAAPIPGHSLRPGLPAPTHARLSTGSAPSTTTIRLVTSSSDPEYILSPPKLKPFQTAFDLVPGSPAGVVGSGSVSVWPLSPGQSDRIYPSIPDFGPIYNAANNKAIEDDGDDMDVDMPGGLTSGNLTTPGKVTQGRQTLATNGMLKWPENPSAGPKDIFSPVKPTAAATLAPPTNLSPFIFGSPLPQHNLSNKQFRSAAQSVLNEMNKRLVDEGVEAVGIDVLEQRKNKSSHDTAENSASGNRVNLGMGDMFNKIHEQEFQKMDSIANHYAAKRGNPAEDAPVSKKRKSSVATGPQRPGPSGKSRASGARVTSGGARKKIVPGAFYNDDEDEFVDRRMSKRPRVEPEQDGKKENGEGTSITLAQLSAEPEEREEETERLQKEREAIRRKLEYNKAKRRSSMGRPSMGGKTPVPAQKAKVSTSRFGFLSSAKSLVQNMWGRGAGGSKTASSTQLAKPTPPAHNAKVSSKITAKKPSITPTPPTARPGTTSTRVNQVNTINRVPSGSIPRGSSSNRLGPSSHDTLNPCSSLRNMSATPSSTRAGRPPIPSFGTSTPNPPTGTSGSRAQSGHLRGSSRSGSIVGVSSLGTRTRGIAGGSRVSSLGTKGIPKGTISGSIGIMSNGGGASINIASPRIRTSSTLLAPTASSLAKTQSLARLSPSSSNDRATNSALPTSSGQHQLNPKVRTASQESKPVVNRGSSDRLFSPRPGKIFSKPLIATSSPSPVRAPPSFGTAGAALAVAREGSTNEDGRSGIKPAIPPKPKVLPGRRPRISRSKVIAKLASQRAAEAGVDADKGKGKIRSSMGAKVGGEVLLSAKKRVRQSEYARRKSRATGSGVTPMNIDD